MSVSLVQHRQLAAFNKHKNLEIFSCRNYCTASNYGPMASSFGMLHYINLKHQCKNSVCKVLCSWLSILDLMCSNRHWAHYRIFLVPFLIPPTSNLCLVCTIFSSKLTNFAAKGVTCITAVLLRFLSDAWDQGTTARNQSIWGTETLRHVQETVLSWNTDL